MSTVNNLLEVYQSTHRTHVKSLISTFFGDLAIRHGGKAWVETIITILEPLGINSRLVRTSLFRLCEHDWLHSTRQGRRSYYQLTDKAKNQTTLAEKLIYYPDVNTWDGVWTIVFIVMNPVNTEARRQLEQQLQWAGFGAVAKHVWAHPTISKEAVGDYVSKLGLGEQVVCMRCENMRDADIGLNVDDREMALQCFSVTEVEQAYAKFIDVFSGFDIESAAVLDNNSALTQLLSFRLLLMDEYRRIRLRDPNLPKQLLPTPWVGDDAYLLCKTIYQKIKPSTEQHYRQLTLQVGDTLLENIDQQYQGRFSF